MNFADLRVVTRLVISHILQRPTRILLTLLSTVAAACVVVWVVSGYDSLVAKFDEFADNYMGRYELIVLPNPATGQEPTSGFGSGPFGGFGGNSIRLTAEALEGLKNDPSVAAVDPVLQTRARITKVGGQADEPEPGFRRPGGNEGGNATRGTPPTPAASAPSDDEPATRTPAGAPGGFGGFGRGSGVGANRTPSLVGTNATEPPYRMTEGQWIGSGNSETPQAAVSTGVAEQLKVKVGDDITVSPFMGGDPVTFRVVGIIEQRKALPTTPPIIGLPAMRGPPQFRGPASAAVYVGMSFAEDVAKVSGKYDYAGIVLKKGASIEDFKKTWTEQLAKAATPSSLQSIQEVDSELENSTTSETIRSQAYSATGISLLAALFIIFSTLSMGVDERIRQFAVLRAVTCTKAQVALMIFLESLILGVVGWGGGLLAGAGILEIVTQSKPELFPVGSSLGGWCIAMSGICSIGGALAAAVMPAWKATRVKPLDAMTPQVPQPPARIPWRATIAGLIFVSMNPLLVFWVPMPDTSRYIASAAVGCTFMGIGFILLAPATVMLTERLLAPVVARLLLVNPKLLATQLSTNMWRTLGATIALTLGLGLFVAMQTWGYSMLGPFTPGDWVPDMVAVMTPSGIPDSEVEAVRHMPGVIGERSLPCVSEQVKFATDVTGAKERATSSRQDNCVLVGVDPDLGLGGDHPVFDFQFAEGTRSEALAKLKQGRYCLVPDHFAREAGLSVGGKFGVLMPDSKDKVVEYEIAGVVSMTGWHWMSKVGLRNRGGGRSAGLMFAAFDQVRKDFSIERINAFWLNVQSGVTEDQIKKSLQEITERNFDSKFSRRGRGGFMGGGMGFGRGDQGGAGRQQRAQTSVNIRSREGVRVAIRERADGIIWLLSRLPLVTLAVTSLGVVNTIVSSVRSRQWDLGVMRAIGVTRFSLFRLILCEALLVGASTCILSFGFGLMAGYCGTGVTRYVNVRGGQITPLVIAWQQIGIGFAMTLGLCLLAALWPAIRTGRTQPLKLLQAGRSAA